MKIMYPMMYVLLGTTLTFISCAKKDIEKIPLVGDIKVPYGFDWAMTQDVGLNMSASTESNVSVYLDEQCTGLVAKLPVSPEKTTYNLEIPIASNAIYLQYTQANGTKAVMKKSLESSRSVSRVALDGSPGQTIIQNIFFDDIAKGPQEIYISRPEAQKFGTLMFEDTWPSKGDYDFNDFVVNYYVLLDGSYVKPSTIKFNFKIRAMGGKFPYRFCVQLKNITKAQFEKFNMQTSSSISGCDVKVLDEVEENDPVILAITGLEQLRSGEYYNVEIDRLHSGVPATVSFTLTHNGLPGDGSGFFELMQNQNQIDYFIQNPDNKMEIHKAGFAPTKLFKEEYAKRAEASKDLLNLDYYYYSKDNYVWMLQVPTEISWASEKTNFLVAYPKFSEWLTSGGDQGKSGSTSHKWYLNPSKDSKVIIDHMKH